MVALPVPSERQETQWYFQRYVEQLPAGGEIALFDRSWYNRAGIEKVLGFCTPEEHKMFLRQCPIFERLLVADGIHLTKYWFLSERPGAGATAGGTGPRPDAPLETFGDGSELPNPLGRLLASEGRDVRAHRYP